jgi:uncharacterized protein
VTARPVAIALLSLFAGCTSQPSRNIYVLNNANDPDMNATGATAAPVLQLQRVLVPDYLDTTDILLRVDKHELRSSHTGRWGERLSSGITYALRDDLADRLPEDAVLLGQSANKAARQIIVTVDAFDVWADGHCALRANWTLTDKNNRDLVSAGRGTFISQGLSGGAVGDRAIVAGMANALSQLADRIASAVKEL